jgi:hypothetical protein
MISCAGKCCALSGSWVGHKRCLCNWRASIAGEVIALYGEGTMLLDIKYLRYEVPVYYTVDSSSASGAALERASLSMGGDAAIGYRGRRQRWAK